VIQLTAVASRRVGYVMAGILAVLGLVPAVGRWVTVVPPPVLGALALMLFGLVAVSGLRLIATAGLGQREAAIVALSLGVGLGLPTQPGLIGKLSRVAALAAGVGNFLGWFDGLVPERRMACPLTLS
jgi:xanthine/uracil permease